MPASGKAARLFCEPVERRVLLSTASFATPLSVSVPGAQAPLMSAQFHGSDHPADFAVATSTTVQILDGSSGGAFTLGATIPLPADPATQTPFVIGDFSGDGSNDIVLNSVHSSTGDGVLTYETSNGNGTFTTGPVSMITNGGEGFTPISAAAADFNGDGKTDLAIIGKPAIGSELILAILTSNGNGTFTESADYPIAGSNADGDTSDELVVTGVTNEIVVYDSSGPDLDVFNGNGSGTFTQLNPTPFSTDLLIEGNFDGNQDLVAANGDVLLLLQNQGGGNFDPDPQGPITLASTITAMTAGDFNLDGHADLITNEGILYGNGDGTFNTTPQALPVSIRGGSGFAGTLQAVDILGDGKPGFAGFTAAGNAIVWVINDTPAPPSIDVTSSDNPAAPGTDIQFTATVSSGDSNISAIPTGQVTFFNGLDVLGTVQLTNGSATIDAGSDLPGGANSISADYTGDSVFSGGTSAVFTQTVLVPSVTTVTSSDNPSLLGDDVIFTAAVTGNDSAGNLPTGTVEFFDGGTNLGTGTLDSTGIATFDSAGALPLGANSITAHYQGDSNFSPSTSAALSQTIEQPALAAVVTATTLPTAIVSGIAEHGTVTVTLTNQTTNPVSADQITVFASSNAQITNAISLTSETSKKGIAIKPKESKVLKLTVKSLPSSLAVGSYTLLAQVSSSVNQQSNSRTGPSVTVAAPFLNLTAATSDGTIKPSPVKAGKFITLTLALTNSGNITTQPAALDIGLSTDGKTQSTPLENALDNLKIKPGHSGVQHLRVKIPPDTSAGMYRIFVSITDDADALTIIGPSFTIET
jgi:hypothetical protein